MIITRITQRYQQQLLTCTWAVSLGFLLFSPAATGQQITPSPDGTGTAVNASRNQFNINGGQHSKDGTNLFHSFQQFGLKDGQVVNFISQPNIRNILGRVVGGDASYINGLIQVIGGRSNLFLMNPAGIVFGSNAQLNVPGSFLATTATGIGFGNNWFQAVGVNEYAMLTGTPSILNFGTAQPGAIANFGHLRVPNGQTLALIGGTVFSPGTLSAPSGQIAIASVPGENLVRISQAGHLLSLEITPSSNLDSASVPLNPLTLSQLLTGGSSNATGVTVNSDGSVQLTNSDLRVEAGDVAIGDTQATGANQNLAVSAQTATVSAARNLTLANRQLQTTGDLKLQAGEAVRIRDSATNSFVTDVGGNLTVQGGQIDIQARNHSQSLLSAGGRITLTSNGTVSGDALFKAGSDFSIATLQGSPGNFASSGGSTIVSGGNVTFGNYAGASLGVQAEGTIAAGDIAITSASSDRPQLVFTAGNLPTPLTGNSTLAPASSSPASIQVGNIAIAGSVFLGAANSIQAASITSNGGDIALVASGDIAAENLNTSTLTTSNAGNITLYSAGGSINTSASTLNASSIAGNGGSIFLYGTNAIAAGGITTSSFLGNGGKVTLYGEGNISAGNIDTSGITAGEISLLSNRGAIDASATTLNATGGSGGGNISLNAYGNIATGNIVSSGGNITLNSQAGAIDVGDLNSGSGSAGGDVGLLAFGSIAAGNIVSNGGNIGLNSISSNNNSISARNFDSSSNRGVGGAIELKTAVGNYEGDIVTGNITSGGGRIYVLSEARSFNAGNSTLNSSYSGGVGGEIEVNTGPVTLGNVISGGGSILFQGDLNVSGVINSSSSTGKGGVIEIVGYDVSVRDIISGDSAIGFRNEPLGGITLNIGALNSTSAQGRGGNIEVKAYRLTTVGNITSGGSAILLQGESSFSATGDRIDSSTSAGVGGNIVLRSYTDITVAGSILSGGGNISLLSSGGSINAKNSFLTSVAPMGIPDGNITLQALGAIAPGTILSYEGTIRLATSSNDPNSIDTSGSRLISLTDPTLVLGSPPLDMWRGLGFGSGGLAPTLPPEPPALAALAPPAIQFPAIAPLGSDVSQPDDPSDSFGSAPTLPPEMGVPEPLEVPSSGLAPTLPSERGVPEPLRLPTTTSLVPTLANSDAIPTAAATVPVSVQVSNTQPENPNTLAAQQLSQLNGARNREPQNLASLTPSATQCLTEEQLLGQQAGLPLQTAPKDYSKAIACYQENLELARLSRDRAREGYALNNLGATYYAIGDYEKAISYHQQRLAQAESRADLLGKGQAFIGLGAAYGAIGNYKKAIEYYEQSLEVAHSLKSADLEASVLRNLGLLYYAQKEYKKAVEYQEQSLAIAKQQRDRRGEALALSNLGLVHYSLTEYAKAIDEQKQSLAIASALGDRFVQGRALENLGIAYYAVKNYRQAIESHQQSLALARELSDRHAEGRALTNLGDALYKAKQPAEAIKALFSAIEIWESLRSNLGNSDLNLVSIFETQETSYSTLQEVLANQNQHKKALEITERGRAQAFVRLLTNRFSSPSAQATLKSSESQIKPLNIQEIQQIAKQQNSTLVSYSIIKEVREADGQRKLQDSELYIWVIQPTGKFDFRRISLKGLVEEKTSLKALVTEGRCFIPSCLRNKQRSQPGTNPTSTRPIVEQRFLDSSLQELYQLLIEPIADLLPQDPTSRITFIPHESLFLVPFAALQDTSGNYLIEKHTILTAPSIQVLSLTKKQQQLASGKGALVVGNPTMPSVAFTTNQPPQKLSSLPHSEAEAIAIAQLLNAEPLTGDKATKVAVLQQIERSRIVHLATHGILDDVEGLGVPGVIALAPSKDDSGLLTASEIFNLRLNAELVVLSACNTGRGRITGDGIIGLSRSFIAAGVPSVVVSLWSVSDESTADLMAEFYRQMQLTPDIAQALRKAMLVTLAKHPNPVDWAAFTLIGEAEKR
ncbi:CHAT domain-containing protein [Microcoleus vaginatus DQ-U2]|uniref:CHAT domain-containing protein n=1 Tax=Microcoleus vaginatus TaxID=119532 RepID=UPI001689C2FE|nr:CHAT domain-containing protein [Microcoleus sp. FACHB-DQ6]